MKTGLMLAGAVVGASLLALSAAHAVDAPKGVMQLAQNSPTPAAVFEERCKFCHDPAVDRAPDRAAFLQRTPESVVEALTRGVMQPMAAGLSAEQIRNLATYLTGKPLAQAQPAATPGATPPAGGGNNALTGGGRSSNAQPADVMCAKTDPVIKATGPIWNGFGRDLQDSRYQPDTTIKPANVSNLKVKWAFSMTGGRFGPPTVIGDRVFVTGAGGQAYSLDSKTGCVHWRAELGAPGRTSPVVEKRAGASPSGWVVYVGDAQRNIHALDGMSGKEIWKLNVEDHPRAVLTGSPILYKDTLYVPISSLEETIASIATYQCCTFSGSVAAIDLNKHTQIWKTKVLDPAQPTRKNSAGTQMFGPSGAAIWSQPSVDVKRKQIYVVTGDSYTEVPANRSDSIVALDMATGKIKWHNQVTQNDNFLVGCGGARSGLNCPLGELGPDYDFGASPIIRDLPGGKAIILAGQKSGIAYGLDADTGKTLWQNKIGAGSALGGIEWGMAADAKALYAGVADIGVAADKAKPGLYAIDIKTGKTLWSTPAPKVACKFAGRCSNGHSAPPAASPGLVFAGAQDGHLRAFDAKDGKILWDFDTAGQTYKSANGVAEQKGGGIDGTGPTIAGDSLYVFSGFSGASGVGSIPVSVLLAFSLDGK